MDDPFLVAVVNCITHVGEKFESRPDGEFVIVSELNDRTGIGDELHHEVRHRLSRRAGVIVHARVVDMGDAVMAESGQDLCFVLESAQGGGRGEAALQDLQGHHPARVLLLGLVDHAHAAGRDDADDAVRADVLGQPLVLGVAGGCRRLGRCISRILIIQQLLSQAPGLLRCQGHDMFPLVRQLQYLRQ